MSDYQRDSTKDIERSSVQSDEHTFLLRFSVRAEIPRALLEDDRFDERSWLDEWEREIKPLVVRAVFQAARGRAGWSAHARSRGASTVDEVELVIERDYTAP